MFDTGLEELWYGCLEDETDWAVQKRIVIDGSASRAFMVMSTTGIADTAWA